MKKKTILFILIIILIGAGIFLSLNNFLFTGRIIQESEISSSTIAICNKTNYCEDYKVECEGNKTSKISATGFSIQHNENWEDPRESHDPENLCNKLQKFT